MSVNTYWSGSGTFITGSSTPFGIYDGDNLFVSDAPKVSTWVAKRLGYPIINVELDNEQIWACFEEATSEYSAQVNQFNIRNNLDVLRGKPLGTNYSQKNVTGTNLPTIFKMSQTYGTLAGVGGNVTIKKGYIDLELTSSNANYGRQVYDLETEAHSADTATFGQPLTGSGVRDVVRVYYEPTPAITRFFDPYSVGAQGTLNLISELGFGNYSPAAQFLMMPIYEDLLRMQHIEFNDTIRKSAYTFNIVDNKISIFPVPSSISPITKLYFDYFERDDLDANSTLVKDNVVSDYSDIQYDFITYSNINDVGKQWIRKYCLALAKELLGAIREKYNTVPIPDGEVQLDGAALRAEAQVEKDALIAQLRETLEELSRPKQMEYKKLESEQQQDMLRKVPLKLYVG